MVKKRGGGLCSNKYTSLVGSVDGEQNQSGTSIRSFPFRIIIIDLCTYYIDIGLMLNRTDRIDVPKWFHLSSMVGSIGIEFDRIPFYFISQEDADSNLSHNFGLNKKIEQQL